jgi:hypothetical protein
MKLVFVLVIILALNYLATGAPQNSSENIDEENATTVDSTDTIIEQGDSSDIDDQTASTSVYKSYQYKYTVADEDQSLFFEKEEAGDETGNVQGKFSVLLANGRLLTVEYEADKKNGFVPKISFKENPNPFQSESNDSS